MISRLHAQLARLSLPVLLTTGMAASEPSWLDDTTRALDAEMHARLERELRSFHEQTGVRLGIKTVAYIDPGVTLRTATRVARRAFSANGPAALILVDRGQNGLGLSYSPELWQRYPLAELITVLRAALLKTNADPDAGIETKMLLAAEQWMADVRRLEQQRRNASRLLHAPDKPVLLACLLLLGGGGFGVMTLAARRRLQETAERRHYEFPEVVVGQRLGAPYGGGHIAEWIAGETAGG